MTIVNSIQEPHSLGKRDERQTLKIQEFITRMKGLPSSDDDVFVNTLRDEFQKAFCDEYGLSPVIFKEEFSEEFVKKLVDPATFDTFIEDVK